MDLETVIKTIITNEKYQFFCKDIANSNSWEDLYQDFREKILTHKNKGNLKEIFDRGEMDLYCYGMIHNNWNQKTRIKKTSKGATSEYFLISDNYKDHVDFYESTEKTEAEKEQLKRSVKYLNKYLSSPNERIRQKADFVKCYINGENRLEISKRVKLNYRYIYESIQEILILIKYDMSDQKQYTKSIIKVKLLSEGCKASYSGKTKTFYVDNIPGGAVCEDIKKAGFNICKK